MMAVLMVSGDFLKKIEVPSRQGALTDPERLNKDSTKFPSSAGGHSLLPFEDVF